MCWKIFLFEIQNRIRRPAVYLYFMAIFAFVATSFAVGAVPLSEKEHINAPFVIAFFNAMMTTIMMLISSSIMGMALYRDIEFNTKDYYLTYPITKAGYFWGRYLGSFACIIFIALAIPLGIYSGTILGPLLGKTDAAQYGPNLFSYYLQPFLTIALPNLFFPASIFFGLVAVTRNVKVIYSGGILLFMGYFLSGFFLGHSENEIMINLSDPFGINGIRFLSSVVTSTQKNNMLFPITGNFLYNRLMWTGVGLVIVLATYCYFNFEKFFSGRRDKTLTQPGPFTGERALTVYPGVSFAKPYNVRTLITLTRTELTNIIRDNYFWIIISTGLIFLAFVFWMGGRNEGVPDLPRTVLLLDIFNDVFPFFIFFVIIFYTGETLHRDRTTRYAFINDALPPPNWVLNGSKLIALLIVGMGLSFTPIITALPVQIAKGFYQFNFPAYITSLLVGTLPRLLEMVVFSYVLHVTINNKFVAHAAGVSIWIVLFFLHVTGIFNYNLLLYSYTPSFQISDMDGIGHMLTAVNWFNLYWLLFCGLLIIVSALFYYRGITSSFKERLQLVKARFNKPTRIFSAIILFVFLSVGGFIYYNISYLNNYLTKGEMTMQGIQYEKQLKHFATLPIPKVTRIKMFVALFPDKQEQFVHAFVTLVNKTQHPISQFLLDGDELTDYDLKTGGKPVAYSCPLVFPRGKFNVFRPAKDTAAFRLYTLSKAMAPGDSLVMELNSTLRYKGFQNGLYGTKLLRNGTFFTGGLPGLGYDEEDEISSPYERKKYNLPEKHEIEIAQDDPEGISTLRSGKSANMLNYDLTVSTSGDQTVLASGELQSTWSEFGRNYFHYVQTQPGMYSPPAAVSARFAVLRDSVMLDHKVSIGIYYHPTHTGNLTRFMDAYKDGLRYFSKAYGTYPFASVSLAETTVYGPRVAPFTTFSAYTEQFGWNAAFDNPDQTDYCYLNTLQQLALQWWRFQVSPNATEGSLVIPEGLSAYSALCGMEQKYGKDNMSVFLRQHIGYYQFIRSRMEEEEHPLIRANEWFEWTGKAGFVLYGLKDLIGEDSINAALRAFREEYTFKKNAPYPGANDLYRYLQQHVPDSLQYYLTDTWQKITLYDNKVSSVQVAPTGKKNEYAVTLQVNVNKIWIKDKGSEVNADQMNDYIDIGVFAANTNNKEGRKQTHPLYLQKHKLSAGDHTITVIVQGKPTYAGIDPYGKLIDRIPNDNIKWL